VKKQRRFPKKSTRSVRVAGVGWMLSSLRADWCGGEDRGVRQATWLPPDTGYLYLYVVR
jgi:hypothetical protein